MLPRLLPQPRRPRSVDLRQPRLGLGRRPPGYRDSPIYGLVQTRTDRAFRKRPGAPDWIANAARREGPRLEVPAEAPEDPYLSEELPI